MRPTNFEEFIGIFVQKNVYGFIHTLGKIWLLEHFNYIVFNTFMSH